MGFGGFSPFPRRFGRSKGQPLEVITGSLLTQLGTAYDTGTGSKVWAKAHATARALWDVWESQQRLRNQFDPLRMTSALGTWERILGIVVGPTATGSTRRAEVARRLSLYGKPATLSTTYDLVRATLPNTFTAFLYETSATSVQHAYITVTADGGVTTPTGTVGIAADGMWGSSIHSVHIQVSQPASMTAADFNTEVGSLGNGVFRRFLPAWVKFNWYKNGAGGAGFFLDETNLDTERLT